MDRITRRDFLKLNAFGIAGTLLESSGGLPRRLQGQGPRRLARVVENRLALRARPDVESPSVGTLVQDDVIPWYREVVGNHPYRINQRWVETDGGYAYAPALQPVKNNPNQTLSALPDSSLGEGVWAEVTIPWVGVTLENPPARAPWLANTINPRLYYSQVVWIDQIKDDDEGNVYYRINERYGFGDRLWADATALRPLTIDEVEPIRPEAEEKRVIVNIARQSLSCFEGEREVYYCRVSTGVKFDGAGNPSDEWATPSGPHPVWRKLISVHMVGGTTGGGWDLPGVGWTSLFVGNGVAVHSTFWHNDFGVPRSRGCVNARPEDAKWIFRWLEPAVPYDPGDVTVSMPGGTIVEVIEQ